MKIIAHWKGLESSAAVHEYLELRLAFALGRIGSHVKRVRVLLSDENGPRGGEDKRCRLQVHSRLGLVQVQETDRDLYAAIDHAAERMRRALARIFAREHFQGNSHWRSTGLLRRRHFPASR